MLRRGVVQYQTAVLIPPQKHNSLHYCYVCHSTLSRQQIVSTYEAHGMYVACVNRKKWRREETKQEDANEVA